MTGMLFLAIHPAHTHMPKHAAGILLYRHSNGAPEVMLVHPGGPYYANRDNGVWSIPKGLFEADEAPLDAAKREFREEIGAPVPAASFLQLQAIRQKGGKIVHAWAAEGDLDVSKVDSNTFPMEYPYKSGKWIQVPEIDRAAWFRMEEASEKILPAQRPLLEELAALIARK